MHRPVNQTSLTPLTYFLPIHQSPSHQSSLTPSHQSVLTSSPFISRPVINHAGLPPSGPRQPPDASACGRRSGPTGEDGGVKLSHKGYESLSVWSSSRPKGGRKSHKRSERFFGARVKRRLVGHPGRQVGEDDSLRDLYTKAYRLPDSEWGPSTPTLTLMRSRLARSKSLRASTLPRPATKRTCPVREKRRKEARMDGAGAGCCEGTGNCVRCLMYCWRRIVHAYDRGGKFSATFNRNRCRVTADVPAGPPATQSRREEGVRPAAVSSPNYVAV